MSFLFYFKYVCLLGFRQTKELSQANKKKNFQKAEDVGSFLG